MIWPMIYGTRAKKSVAETGDLYKLKEKTKSQAGRVNGCKKEPARQG